MTLLPLTAREERDWAALPHGYVVGGFPHFEAANGSENVQVDRLEEMVGAAPTTTGRLDGFVASARAVSGGRSAAASGSRALLHQDVGRPDIVTKSRLHPRSKNVEGPCTVEDGGFSVDRAAGPAVVDGL